MKRIIVLMLAVMLIITAVAGSRIRARAEQLPQNENVYQKSIAVKASEEISVAPNVAHVNLSVTTKDLNVQKAQKANAEIVNKATEKIAALGINKEDITTQNYNVYPDYEYTAGTSRQKGHIVTVSIKVKVEDFALIGKVIDEAGANGVNGVSGVEFSLSDSTGAYNAALAKAVENAKAKAQIIAAAHQTDLGALLSIKEVQGYENKISAYAVRTFAEDASMSTSVNPDKLTVKASVEIVYLIG